MKTSRQNNTEQSNRNELNTSPEKKEKIDNQRINNVAGTIFAIFLIAGILGAIIMDSNGVNNMITGIYVCVTTLIGTLILFSLKVSNQWEKAVILRFGKFYGLRGPGVFWIVPLLTMWSIGLTSE